MTSEQVQYLKHEIDARRREILAASGDRKFQQHTSSDDARMHPLLAGIALMNIAVLMSLALMVEHLAR